MRKLTGYTGLVEVLKVVKMDWTVYTAALSRRNPLIHISSVMK